MRFTMLKLPAFFLVQFLRRKADCEKKKKQQRTNTTVVAFAGRIGFGNKIFPLLYSELYHNIVYVL